MTILKETYEQADIHNEWISVYRRNPLQQHFNTRLMDKLLKRLALPDNALILDAGCGTGEHSIRIAQGGYRCVGIDISERTLRETRNNISRAGLDGKVTLHCESLETLSFPDETFDAVHCRGVLMHVPAFEAALRNLCRVLKPGGKILLMETNHEAIETRLVLLVRKVMRRESTMNRTRSGLEFWSEREGRPFLVRISDVQYLMQQLNACGVKAVDRLVAEFWDINRFPAGFIRNSVIRFNVHMLGLGIPPSLGVGNVIIGEKVGAE